MKNLFKVDDEVICINNNGIIIHIQLGKKYKIKYFTHDNKLINLYDMFAGYNCKRFIKYSDRHKPENKKIMLELVKKRLIGNI